MRIAILTSTETRHRYFVNAIRGRFDVVAVGYEQTGYDPADTADFGLTAEEDRIVAAHFADRSSQEQRFFGHDDARAHSDGSCSVYDIAPGMLNSPETLGWLERARADTVLIYGTNLIREPLLSGQSGRMINLHLGLSPYYRGTATNFYPLLNDEPEYVGTTIHLIDAGIDSGAIIRHARPEITSDDGPHTIGCKAILAGIETLVQALDDAANGRMRTTSQWSVPNARLYLRKEYHPRQVVELYRKLGDGLIPRYVERARRVAPLVRLVE